MSLSPGTTLGRYQILEPLGTGGMATVYKAYQPALEREIALKVIRQALVEEPEFAQRFRREATAVARLQHPNIVQVHDFEEVDGRAFLAMQYLDGGTLKDRLSALRERGELLPAGETARIVEQVAAALAYAHGRGIVHRDVKPSNVMLSDDRAIVTDFGIAKILGASGQTQTGVGIGTPEYMSPEQSQGGKVDARSDVYSLAVMAYEMLVGRVPFVADTPLAVALAQVRDPLPLPSTLNPRIGQAAERVLLKALAKDPAARHESTTDFARALSAALASRPADLTAAPTVAPIARRRRIALRSRPALAAAGAAILVVIAASGALVSGAFGRGDTAPLPPSAATSGPAQPGGAPAQVPTSAGSRPIGAFTPAPKTPAPPPKFAVPAKGDLVWQSKLDGTADTGLRQSRGPTGASTIDYKPGAIEVAVRGQGVSVGGQLPTPLLVGMVLETELSVQPGANLRVSWNLGESQATNDLYYLEVDTRIERITLYYIGDKAVGAGAQLLGAEIAGLQQGRAFTVALVSGPTGLALYIDQVEVGRTSDARASRASVPSLNLLTTPSNTTGGVVRILGLRVYALPT